MISAARETDVAFVCACEVGNKMSAPRVERGEERREREYRRRGSRTRWDV